MCRGFPRSNQSVQISAMRMMRILPWLIVMMQSTSFGGRPQLVMAIRQISNSAPRSIRFIFFLLQ
jgi:hypothetical protein